MRNTEEPETGLAYKFVGVSAVELLTPGGTTAKLHAGDS
jgi:hypothetical protein